MTDEVTAASPAADEIKTETENTSVTETNQTDAQPADSSPAGDNAETLTDVVKAALTKGSAQEAPPASEAKPESTDTEAKPETEGEDEEAEDNGEISDDDKKVISEKTQRRIRKLARQRDEFKPLAERTMQMDTFMRNNGISADDAIGAFEVLALMRTQPTEALKRLRDVSYQLSLSIGETIPKDIQDRVDAGTIDEATGRELAIARAKASGLETTANSLSQVNAEQQARQTKAEITKSVNDWEAEVSTRDPDFAAKKPLLESQFRALLQEGEKLQTKDDAVRLMKKAYTRVNESIKAFRPHQKTEVRPATASPNAAQASEPKTMEEAIRRSLNAA